MQSLRRGSLTGDPFGKKEQTATRYLLDRLQLSCPRQGSEIPLLVVVVKTPA
jgi:hypothetical protein